MKYYISSLERVKICSCLAYKLTQPDITENVTKYIFNWHEKDDLGCAIIHENATIPVNAFIKNNISNNDSNSLDYYFNNLYLTQTEINDKKQTIANSCDDEGNLIVNIPILLIFPSDWQEVDMTYLQENNWFPENEI